jgi:hypothetical protein
VRFAVPRSIPLCLLFVCMRAATAPAQVSDSTRAPLAPAPAAPVAADTVPAPVAPAPSPDTTAPAPAPAAVDSSAAVPDAAAAPATPAVRRLAAGDVVRLRSAAGRYRGTLERVTADTLVISSPGRTDAVPRADLVELQRLAGRGPRGRAMLRGGAVGLVSGAALGLLAGLAAGHVRCDPADTGCTPGRDEKIGVALTADGALIGTLVGVMTGPALRRAQWESVNAAPGAAAAAPGVSVAPAPGGGISVGARLKL